jgi:hypothetical protein
MFPFRASRTRHRPFRAHRQLCGIHSSRLGVESMEGRLMLSATSSGVTVPEPPIAQFDTSSSQLNSANGPLAVVTPPGDGGYINANPFPMVTFHFSGSPTGLVTDANDLASLPILSVTRSSPSGSNGAIQFNDTPSYTAGLQPVVITFSNSALTGQLSAHTLTINPTETASSPGEGGAIPIHAIGAGLRQEASLLSGNSSAPSLLADMTAAARSSIHPADSSQKAITGEWARAVIFEFAGGEPGAGEHVGAGDRRATSQDSQATFGEGPISSVEFQGAAMTSLDRQGATSNSGSGFAQSSQPQTQNAGNQVAVAFYRTSREGSFGCLNNGSPRSDSSLSPASAQVEEAAITGATNIDGATAAAFDQIGQSKIAIIESSAARSQRTRYHGAAPLLMVLALERLAAINSRHSAKESPATSSKKSRRARILNNSVQQ